ncbi:MAG: hypothetical protein LUD03_00290 [Firmicutes bacterium]|nr:hypothetical protein [Bacillota bacterium]
MKIYTVRTVAGGETVWYNIKNMTLHRINAKIGGGTEIEMEKNSDYELKIKRVLIT